MAGPVCAHSLIEYNAVTNMWFCVWCKEPQDPDEEMPCG